MTTATVTTTARRVQRFHNQQTPQRMGAFMAFDEDGSNGRMLEDDDHDAMDQAGICVVVREHKLTERQTQDILDCITGR